jgi:hypothetical protein
LLSLLQLQRSQAPARRSSGRRPCYSQRFLSAAARCALVSALSCRLFTDRCGQCAHTTVPLGTVSRHAPVTGVPSLALRCSRSQAPLAARKIFVGDAPPVPAQVSTPTHPAPMLKPDGGRSGGVSVSECASRTRKHALVKSRVITMRHHILPGAKRRPARPRRLSPTVRPPRQPRALSAAGRRTGCGCARVPGLLRRRAAQAVGGRQRLRDDGTDRTSGESLPLRVPEAGTGSQGTLSTPSTRSACGTPREVLLLSARTASAAAARPFLALPRPAASNSAPPAVRASLALCLSACLCAHV